jgi:flagellar motor switch protein FliG
MPMTNEEKIALIFLALGNEDTQKIVQNLSHEEQIKIIKALSRLKPLTTSAIEEVMRTFLKSYESTSSSHSLAPKDKILGMMGEKIGESSPSWAKERGEDALIEEIKMLSTQVDLEFLERWIKSEHPQTLAYFLSICPIKIGSFILKNLDNALKIEVIEKIIALEGVEEEELKALYEELLKLSKEGVKKKIGGKQNLILMFENLTDDGLKHALLEKLNTADPKLYEEIIKESLSIQKLSTLIKKDLERFLASVDDKTLVSVLYRVEPPIKEIFLSAISHKRREIIEEHFSYEKPLSKNDYEAIKQKFIQKAVSLEEQGLIIFPWKDKVV